MTPISASPSRPRIVARNSRPRAAPEDRLGERIEFGDEPLALTGDVAA
jgi:hypothetical protein